MEFESGQFYTGDYFQGQTFYTGLNFKLQRFGVQYNLGLNDDPSFNLRKIRGFEFYKECETSLIIYYKYIAIITVPKNAIVFSGGFFTSDKIIVERIVKIPQFLEENEDVRSKFLSNSMCTLEMIESQNEEFMENVGIRGTLIIYVKNQTREICMEAISDNFYCIQLIEQTPELCMDAVKFYGCILELIEVQTPELCLEAVKNDGRALEYVENQTLELCLTAVKENGLAIKYAKYLSPEILLEAVRENGLALQYINDPTDDVCIEAVKQNPAAINYVKNITPEILEVKREILPIDEETRIKNIYRNCDNYSHRIIVDEHQGVFV